MTNDLVSFGQLLDVHGFAGADVGLRRIVREAHNSGLNSASLDVLGDTAAPDVVRSRAFAVVAAALTRLRASVTSTDRVA